jgi:hypothetical protein
MNKHDLKVGDWVRINVDEIGSEDFYDCLKGFYRGKTAKVHKLLGNGNVAVLDIPSYYYDSPHGGRACLGVGCLEKIGRQLTFIFTGDLTD